MNHRILSTLAVAGLVLVAGCTAQLNQTMTANLDPTGQLGTTYDLKAQAAEQTLKVDVSSSASEVNIYVVDAKNWAEFDKQFSFEAKSKKAMASKQKVKADVLTATIPPNTEVKVAIDLSETIGSKKSDVTVKLTNRN